MRLTLFSFQLHLNYAIRSGYVYEQFSNDLELM